MLPGFDIPYLTLLSLYSHFQGGYFLFFLNYLLKGLLSASVLDYFALVQHLINPLGHLVPFEGAHGPPFRPDGVQDSRLTQMLLH